ncbi:MAG: DNA-3-methyladenine glycosylase I, partial [Chloroflexi bacterium]|nr:DNA-3-methyladenine glycosylase I [Chloroflexota bacterium]
LLSTGTLPGAHDHECPVYEQIARKIPAWMQK